MDQQQQSGEYPELMKFFTDQLKDTMNAEKQLLKALPKMAKATTSEELSEAFLEHKAVTEQQVSRLEEVFAIIGKKPSSKKCEAMEGLIKEAMEAMESTNDEAWTRDVALIVAAQKAEHYEIAAYGSLRALAETLGLQDAAALLQQTLDEEGETDKMLTELAGIINMRATEIEGEDDNDTDDDDEDDDLGEEYDDEEDDEDDDEGNDDDDDDLGGDDDDDGGGFTGDDDDDDDMEEEKDITAERHLHSAVM